MTAAIEQKIGLSLFHSPRGLLDFQAVGVAAGVCNQAEVIIFDKGTGKTIIGLAAACLLVEDGLVDVVLFVGRARKVKDFTRQDFPRFTDLTVGEYVGSIDRRRRMLADPPQVLVTSYETGRRDICEFAPRRKAVKSAGMLTQFLRSRRVLVVFDEVTKFGSRTSLVYIAWDYLINRVLRRRKWAGGGQHLWVIGLTASTVRKNPENHYNICRLLDPDRAGDVEDFKRDHIAGYDRFGVPSAFKNISEEDHQDRQVATLVDRLAPIVVRKRKSDPDVIAQFPSRMENLPTLVELSKLHRDFITAVYDLYPTDPDEMARRQQWNLIRQIVAHPAALAHGQGAMARRIVAEVGADALMRIGSAKVEATIDWAGELGGDAGVIFTFFGPSVIPILGPELIRAGFTVAMAHSGLSPDRCWEEERAFKAGEKQLFLTSDAGAQGANLGIGAALLHYEPALNYDTHDQRSDRIHRIDSVCGSVTVDLLLAVGTPDVHAYELITDSQRHTEQVIDHDLAHAVDDGRLTVARRLSFLASLRVRP